MMNHFFLAAVPKGLPQECTLGASRILVLRMLPTMDPVSQSGWDPDVSTLKALVRTTVTKWVLKVRLALFLSFIACY